MPTPRKGESKDDYISRCIPILKDEGKPQDQAVAICYSMWKQKNEDILKRISRYVKEEDGATTASNIETNIAKGKIDVVGGKCPEGYKYDSKKKVCVPIVKESSVVGGSYVDGTTINIIGSGQTRAVGNYDNEIKVLKTKKPGLITRFNSFLGMYTVEEEPEE